MTARKRVTGRAVPVWQLGAALLLVAGLMATAWVWRAWTTPSTGGGSARPSRVEVRIPTGATLTAVTDSLVRQGLLRHPRLFRYAARLTGRDRRLQAGRYSLPYGLAPRDLLGRLVAGSTVLVRITIPEGKNAREAASIVAAGLGCTAELFLSAADSVTRVIAASRDLLGSEQRLADYDSLFLQQPAGASRVLHWAEGYLAPDTYHFAEGTEAAVAAATIVGMGATRLDSVYRHRSPRVMEQALTPHELLTLASIVEAEARRDDERPRIAAVYLNRIRKGWRLEADPCVAYFLEKRGQRLLYKDLSIASPYNTYRHPGLPPGPIGNPGLAAMKAAAAPDLDGEIIFFVSDGEGGHVFSRTRQEHEQAVNTYRQKRRGTDR